MIRWRDIGALAVAVVLWVAAAAVNTWGWAG